MCGSTDRGMQVPTTEENPDVARAEELIAWLRRQSISRRSRAALLSDLRIVTGERPADGRESRLRGLDPAGFVEQLHAPGGGVLASIPGVGEATIAALRGRIPAGHDSEKTAPQPSEASEQDTPAQSEPKRAASEPREPKQAAPEAAEPQAATEAGAEELSAISAAAEGLLVPSESDAPLTPFRWEGPGPLTPEGLLAQLKLPPDAPVERRSLEQFFAPLATAADWMDDRQRAQAGRFAELRDLIAKELADVAVYRLGRTRIAVVIAGAAGGATVGLRTTVIET